MLIPPNLKTWTSRKKMGTRLIDGDEFQRQHDDKHGGVVDPNHLPTSVSFSKQDNSENIIRELQSHT